MTRKPAATGQKPRQNQNGQSMGAKGQQTRQRLLLTEIDEAVVMAHQLRVDRAKFLALVQERLDYFESKATASTEGK